MQRVEQIDDIARVVVHGGCWRIGDTVVETAQLRGDNAPAVGRQAELRLPHAGVQWKGVQEQECPARPIALRWGFEVPQLADGWHGQIVGDQLSLW